MKISSTHTNRLGQTVRVEYSEDDPFVGLEGKILQAVHAFCFCGDKLVIVKHPMSGWIPPGGHIEQGESVEDAVIREVKEETNMRVIFQKVIGFQDVYEPDRIVRQVRVFCVAEPYGEFIADPDGEIREMKLIDPADAKSYFDWRETGDRVMARAREFKRGCDESLNPSLR